ncbi:MAG: DNA primase [Clostridia bacterium]|nr:DNA primase [Clostridia bacterium]
MISRDVVDEILDRTNIEDLVSGYVSLKRAGSNLKGLCPFHSEKSPSFTVYPRDNSFYCFGCGIGGNAITFVRQIEHMDYPDAVVYLGKRAGITVVKDAADDAYNAKKIDKSRFYKMNVDAAKYFHSCLFAKDPAAQNALRYFTEARGLSIATIRHFGLGFAPDSFDAFGNHMRSLGYSYDELVEGFLCGKSERGKYYDAFRNRVMFPIIDVSGNVIAFGGRVMDDSKPKYKNSSDTPVFKKLRNLFALNYARHTCSENLILCEGYMDVIALHAAGFTNAVATLGTAITSDQARLMSRYTKRVIITYDADEAGQKAAVRAMGMLSEVGLEVSVLKIPDAKDPDEFIKKFGKDKFRLLIENSRSKFEYNMERILSKYNLDAQQERINALKELVEFISTFYSEVERDVYIQAVSKQLNIPFAALKNDVSSQVKKRQRRFLKEENQKAIRQTQGFSDKVNPDFAKAPSVAKNEETVIGLLSLFENHQKKVFEGKLLTENDFYTDLNRRIFIYLRDCYESGIAPNLDENFSTEEVGRVTKMKLARMDLTENGDAVLEEAIASLKSSMQKKSAEGTSTMDALTSLIERMRNSTDN